MIFESLPYGAQKGMSIKFDTKDLPIIRDVFSKYASDNQELFEKNARYGFIFHAFLEVVKDCDEPITIGLKYEYSEVFLEEMAYAIRDHVENDLLPFREAIVPPEFSWSVGLEDNEESLESPVPDLDDRIVRAARLAMYFEELIDINSKGQPVKLEFDVDD